MAHKTADKKTLTSRSFVNLQFSVWENWAAPLIPLRWTVSAPAISLLHKHTLLFDRPAFLACLGFLHKTHAFAAGRFISAEAIAA